MLFPWPISLRTVNSTVHGWSRGCLQSWWHWEPQGGILHGCTHFHSLWIRMVNYYVGWCALWEWVGPQAHFGRCCLLSKAVIQQLLIAALCFCSSLDHWFPSFFFFFSPPPPLSLNLLVDLSQSSYYRCIGVVTDDRYVLDMLSGLGQQVSLLGRSWLLVLWAGAAHSRTNLPL